jgi:hypothetical protein
LIYVPPPRLGVKMILVVTGVTLGTMLLRLWAKFFPYFGSLHPLNIPVKQSLLLPFYR